MSLLVAACGSDGDDAATTDDGSAVESTTSAPVEETLPVPIQQLDIDGDEYTFAISPDPAVGIQPGWTLVNFDNVGVEPHQVMFARLKDDTDMEELAEAGAGDSSGAAAIEFVDMLGGVSYIDAGNGTKALVKLTEGLTMAMCYVPTADGVAHGLLGMTTSLNVAAPGGAATPDADAGGGDATIDLGDDSVVGTIDFADDGYSMPDEMPAGWYHVTNTSDALHELSLLKLGRSLDDRQTQALVEALAVNEVPDIELDAVGGMGAVSAGFDGYLYLDLEPGEYLAVDFMPDPGDPSPHMLDGYYATFSV